MKYRFGQPMGVLIGLAVAMAAAAQPVAQPVGKKEEPPAAKTVTLGELLNPNAPDPERQRQALIQAPGKDSGAWEALRGRTVRTIDAREAALEALRHNLSLLVISGNEAATTQVLREAEAVFDPVFTVGVTFNDNRTYDRTFVGTVTLKTSVSQPIVLPAPPNATYYETQIVFQNLYSSQGPLTGINYASTGVSRGMNTADPKSLQYSVSVDQQLPWGSSVSLGVTTKDQAVYYKNGLSLGADWSSSFMMNLSVPIPGSKDFGPKAANETAILLRKKQKEMASWTLKAAIDSTLLSVDTAYWSLVGALENLAVARQNLDLMKTLDQRTEELFAKGAATRYDKAQVEHEVDQAALAEEQVRSAFLSASNTLAVLISEDPLAVNTIYVPAGFWEALGKKPESFDLAKAQSTAQEKRAALHLAQVALESSEIQTEYSRHQTRPDLNMTMGIQLGQQGNPYGYKSPFNSLSNLFRPDSLSNSFAVNYAYPWKNRAKKAQLALDEANLEGSQASQQDMVNQVQVAVDQAVVGVIATREQVVSTQHAVEQSEEAYQRVKRRLDEIGNATYFEVIDAARALNHARQQWALARVAAKQAETNLLAQEGVLAARYPDRTSLTTFDEQRLTLLDRQGLLNYFSTNKESKGK